MGIMASMALRPVAMGSRTPWRSMMPGARRSTGSVSVVAMGPLSSMGMPERVDHAADHGLAHGHGENLAGALDLVAFAELGVLAQDDRAHLVFFQGEGEAGDVVRKAEQLAGHHLVEAVQAGNAVAERGDGPDLVDLDLRVVVRDLLAKKLRNFVCFDLSHLRSSGIRDQGSGIRFSACMERRSITAYLLHLPCFNL